jgi:hypothetical protein
MELDVLITSQLTLLFQPAEVNQMRIESIVRSFAVAVFVVVLVGITAAQAPLLTSERLAAAAVEKLSAAEATYVSVIGGNYGSLQQLATNGFIDSLLASGEKYGYSYTVTVTLYSPKHGAAFKVSAVPLRYGKNGRRSYYLDSTGVLRGADHQGAPATVQDPAISLCYGNEEMAIGSMRTIHSAEATYFSTNGANINFGTLSNLAVSGLIDPYLGSGGKCGYSIRVINIAAVPATGTPASFRGLAVPMEYPSTGLRSFYIDENGVVRGADHGGAFATASDPPVQSSKF